MESATSKATNWPFNQLAFQQTVLTSTKSVYSVFKCLFSIFFSFVGIDVHFLHVKPSHLPEGQSAKPLLMIHGWPGSFYEFYKIIPLLTDPASHCLNGGHVFEIIAPSIPGYGFSEAPHKKGMFRRTQIKPC